jgi:hypothetical protein
MITNLPFKVRSVGWSSLLSLSLFSLDEVVITTPSPAKSKNSHLAQYAYRKSKDLIPLNVSDNIRYYHKVINSFALVCYFSLLFVSSL